jgi:3'-5' exoribonuclease
MKRQFVAQLQEGDSVNDYFVAVRKDLRDQSGGGKFLGMVFKDKTGEIGGILWSNAQSVARLFEIGDVVNVRGSVASHQDRLQIRVDQVLPLRESEYSTEDLVESPVDSEENLQQFLKALESIKNPWIKRLIDLFFSDQEFVSRYKSASAGKKWHHANPGGLVRHAYEMSRIAQLMCEMFPQINRDILLAGVFLHDIGKLEEMSQDLFVDYTTAGKLLGHLEIGVGMVRKKIDQIQGFPELLRLQLMHCILAHHGALENGSPVVPKTLEALVLYHCDNMDAQCDALVRIIQDTREKHQEWSEFLPLINRQVWAGE